MPKSTNLDNPDTYLKLDPSGFGKRLMALPESARVGWKMGGESSLSMLQDPPWRILIAGVGGSAIGGELIKCLADYEENGTQIVCWRNFGLPNWVDRRTLVIAISVSGNTVETRSAVSKAISLQIPVLVVTGPGPLRSQAKTADVPIIEINHHGEPRTALGLTFLAPYRTLQLCGLMKDRSKSFESAIESLEKRMMEWQPEIPTLKNRAKQIAYWIESRIPAVWGAAHLTGVAMRWKTQFNENADSPAFWEQLPEATHNAVQGMQKTSEYANAISTLVLDSDRYENNLTNQVAATLENSSRLELRAQSIKLETQSMLSEILELIILGDMTSYYLAIIRGRNPSITPVLDTIKNGMTPNYRSL